MFTFKTKFLYRSLFFIFYLGFLTPSYADKDTTRFVITILNCTDKPIQIFDYYINDYLTPLRAEGMGQYTQYIFQRDNDFSTRDRTFHIFKMDSAAYGSFVISNDSPPSDWPDYSIKNCFTNLGGYSCTITSQNNIVYEGSPEFGVGITFSDGYQPCPPTSRKPPLGHGGKKDIKP